MVWRHIVTTAKPATAGRWWRETTTEAWSLSHAISIRSGARTGRVGVILSGAQDKRYRQECGVASPAIHHDVTMGGPRGGRLVGSLTSSYASTSNFRQEQRRASYRRLRSASEVGKGPSAGQQDTGTYHSSVGDHRTATTARGSGEPYHTARAEHPQKVSSFPSRCGARTTSEIAFAVLRKQTIIDQDPCQASCPVRQLRRV